MAPPRPPKPDSTPDPFLTPGGGGVTVDKAYEIVQRLTSIESSLTFVVASVDDSKKKIEALAKDVTEAKAKFETLKTVVSKAGKGIWAIFVLLLTFGLSVLGMWLKHHNGW